MLNLIKMLGIGVPVFIKMKGIGVTALSERRA